MIRKTVSLFLILAILTYCLSAFAENTQTDFPYLRGITTNSSFEEISEAIGNEGVFTNYPDDFVQCIEFNNVNLPRDWITADITFTQYTGGFHFSVTYYMKSIPGPNITYPKLIAEMDEIYQGRSKQIFSTTKEMSEAFASVQAGSLDNVKLSTCLSGVRTTLSEIYKNLENITLTDARFIDDHFLAVAAYSDTVYSSMIVFTTVDYNGVKSYRESKDATTYNNNRSNWFSFPDGVDWYYSKLDVMAALEKASTPYKKKGDLIAICRPLKDDMMDLLFSFSNNRLVISWCFPYETGYEELLKILKEEYGEPFNDISSEILALINGNFPELHTTNGVIYLLNSAVLYACETQEKRCYTMTSPLAE